MRAECFRSILLIKMYEESVTTTSRYKLNCTFSSYERNNLFLSLQIARIMKWQYKTTTVERRYNHQRQYRNPRKQGFNSSLETPSLELLAKFQAPSTSLLSISIISPPFSLERIQISFIQHLPRFSFWKSRCFIQNSSSRDNVAMFS